MANNFTDKANFIWTVSDLIRDDFKRGKYQDIILPLTVLRRIDGVLEPTKDKVLGEYEKYKDKLKDIDPDFAERLTAILFERYRKSMQNGMAG